MNASGIDSVPVRDVGDVRETSGRVHRSNRALRYFPPAVSGIRLNPVGSAVRLVHWLLDKLLGPDSAAIPRILARWSVALDHGSCRLVQARSDQQGLIDAAPISFNELSPARRRRTV